MSDRSCAFESPTGFEIYQDLFNRSMIPKVVWSVPNRQSWGDCFIYDVNAAACKAHQEQWNESLTDKVSRPASEAWTNLSDFLAMMIGVVKDDAPVEFEYDWAPDKRQPLTYRVYISKINEDCALVVYQDITEMKRRQDDLDWFASAASHDLRSPLVGASTALTRMKTHMDRGGVEMPPRALTWFGHIEESLALMERKVSAFVDYVRAPGHADKSFGLDGAINDALEGTSLLLDWERDPTLRLQGSREAYGIALHQLFTNSQKYAHPDRELKVELRTEKTDSGRLLVSVADNGIGVDPEKLMSIFSPRVRLHGNEIPGVGLGLATCRRIMESHKMPIWAESDGSSGLAVRFEAVLSA